MIRSKRYQFRNLLILLLLFGILIIPATATMAQSFDFTVPELRMEVFVLPDGSARIIYNISFANSPFGEPINVIDIGTPTENYDLSNMTASIDGAELSDIRVSEYIDTGVEIHLGDRLIPAGETSTLRFAFTMPDMVYQDTTDSEYASFRIRPTDFDSSLVSGVSDIWIAVHTPQGIDESELLYQNVPLMVRRRKNTSWECHSRNAE
jgi:hypothetical protein